MQRLAKHEGEDDKDDEYALSRVHDNTHPHALPPPRGVGGEDDVCQGGWDRPRDVQMVEGEQNPVCYEISPPEDASHPRQQKPPKEQVLAEDRDEDQLHDDHREPAPRSAEELLATGGVYEYGEIPVSGSGGVEAEELPDAEEYDEGDHPQPHPSTHTPAPRIAGREQPEGIAHARPAKGPQLAPGEDQGQYELPDEPSGEAQQQGLNECCIAPPSRVPSKGAITQARTAMGMAAAAHTARI